MEVRAITAGAELTERELLAAACDGDSDAFRRLVEPHGTALHAHCYRMLGSLHDSEDAMQEALLRAWRGLCRFDRRSALSSWLYRIATNVCLDAVRRNRHIARPVDATELAGGRAPDATVWRSPSPHRVPDDAGGSEPEAAVVARETLELALLAAVRHLPPRQRAVLVLRDGLGWSAREAAQAAGTSVAAANSALQRARATLARVARGGRLDWRPAAPPNPDELEALARWIGVVECFTGAPGRRDAVAVGELLRAPAADTRRRPSAGRRRLTGEDARTA